MLLRSLGGPRVVGGRAVCGGVGDDQNACISRLNVDRPAIGVGLFGQIVLTDRASHVRNNPNIDACYDRGDPLFW